MAVGQWPEAKGVSPTPQQSAVAASGFFMGVTFTLLLGIVNWALVQAGVNKIVLACASAGAVGAWTVAWTVAGLRVYSALVVFFGAREDAITAKAAQRKAKRRA